MALLEVFLLFEKSSPCSGTCYATTDLSNPFFLESVSKDDQKKLAPSFQGQKYAFSVLPQGRVNPPVLVRKDLFVILT